MNSTLYLDVEVKAPFKRALDIIGLDNYARHSNTRLLLFSYAIDDLPIKTWDLTVGEPIPKDLMQALTDESMRLVAHNAQFDRVVLSHLLPKYVKDLSIVKFCHQYRRWYCTRAKAYAHGLPGSLSKLSTLYGLKDLGKSDGKNLIEKYCEQGCPKDSGWTDFVNYSKQDVEAVRALNKVLPDMSFTVQEQNYYALNQKINDFGFKIDKKLAECMVEASLKAQSIINKRISDLTNGTVIRGTQRDKLHDILKDLIPDMRAETIKNVLRNSDSTELNPVKRELLELRLCSAKNSIAKCRVALDTAGQDDRIRYTIVYGGGGRNLRDSHEGFQPGNLPRPSASRKELSDQYEVVEALLSGYANEIWGVETLTACADVIRGLIIPEKGNCLISADWSNIEGRMLAWLANEKWKLNVYRAQDSGKGADGYKLLGARMTGKHIDSIDDYERQKFKVVDLSMGYGGGVGAFVKAAHSSQLDLEQLSVDVMNTLGDKYLEKANDSWDWAVKNDNTYGLAENVYKACAMLRDAYRDACSNIVSFWNELEECALSAFEIRETIHSCANGKVKFTCDKEAEWLAMQIPSGRHVMFAKPRLESSENGKKNLSVLKSPMWNRESVYGGYLANAVTQSSCRDILIQTMLDIDAAGYDIIMDIHDEIIIEVKEEKSKEALIDIARMMTKERPWCKDMPLSVKAKIMYRYGKA